MHARLRQEAARQRDAEQADIRLEERELRRDPEGELRELKRTHLGIDEVTDVLSFPIDGRDEVPDGVPRALGDVVVCPQVVGEEWRAPLVHGLLHLLGYDHEGDDGRMERIERRLRRKGGLREGLIERAAGPKGPAPR